MTDKSDPFAQLKAAQREAWSLFLPIENYTIIPAAQLVKFAAVQPGETVLDVACGTGVVAVTAARAGANVRGIDLSPVLIQRAREHANLAAVHIEFLEGDAECLPYPDAAFDVVLSQFGHIFAPRPQAVIGEMLRVLRPNGRIAFSTWPPELFTGRLLTLIRRYLPPPAPGSARPAPPEQWGDPQAVRERLAGSVDNLTFESETLVAPSLSPQHTRLLYEATIGPLAKVVEALKDQPAKLARLRGECEAMIGEYFRDNGVRQHFMLTRATKHA